MARQLSMVRLIVVSNSHMMGFSQPPLDAAACRSLVLMCFEKRGQLKLTPKSLAVGLVQDNQQILGMLPWVFCFFLWLSLAHF